MFAYERKQQILDLLKIKKAISVEELCKTLYTSGATIRRDLQDLEKDRLIKRTHGGAVLLEGTSTETPLVLRESENSSQKQLISELAVKHISDGMTLFFDSSSTVSYIIRQLHQFQGLKVITNGIKTASLLSDYKNIKIYCTGGIIRDNSRSLVGHSAQAFIAQFNADVCFMSCRGLSLEKGATDPSDEEAYIKKEYLSNSDKRILLCDTTKIGVNYFCKVAPLHEFDYIITNSREATEKYNAYTRKSAVQPSSDLPQ